jgi:molybdate transport system regulatory protein
MRITYKVWLDSNGKAFGEGPYELLKRVGQTRSLRQAANQMGMSYSKAWNLIGTMEERLGFPLIERKVGGRSGGGSHVTLKAKQLMNRYEGFSQDVDLAIRKIYRKHFG